MEGMCDDVLFRLELQAAFAGSISKRFDAPVILVVATVEFDRFDASCFGLFGNDRTEFGSRFAVSAVGDVTANRFVSRADADDRLADFIVDQLTAEVLERSLNRHARLCSRTTSLIADVLASTKSLLLKLLVFIHLNTDQLAIRTAE